MERSSRPLPEDKILKAANELRKKLDRPVVVGIDGGSGAGKTTLAAKLLVRADVRRQGFWDNRRRELTEALVHQVCHIRPLHLDEASGAV